MITWIIIIVLAILILFFVRLSHLKQRAFIILLIILALFVYATISIVNSKNKMDFTTSQGFLNSMKVYGGWLANGFNNLKVLAGNAVKMDWISTNGTFSDNSKSNFKSKK
jgi:CDP-diglyceride synthetase